jgi:AraC-like DNA-binding protein
MSGTLINILSSIILFQLALLACFLFVSREGKKISNRILGAFFLWLAFNISDGLLSLYGVYQTFPALAHLEDGFIFLLGPLLYFYTYSLVYRDFSFRKQDAFHLLPFILVTAVYQIYYHTQPAEYQQMIQRAIAKQDLPPGFYFSVSIIYLHVIVYLFYSFQKVFSYRQRIRQKFSAVHQINLDWLLFMLTSVVVIVLISMIFTFLPTLGKSDLVREWVLIPFAFIFVFCSVIFWKALRQPRLFAGFEIEEEKKYQTSYLSNEEKVTLSERLIHLMKSEKPFLNPDLSIDQLGDLLKVSPRKVSQVINEVFEQNYFDLINTYRIEEAQRIFRESNDSRLTVLEVMYQSGFNSKSSFNTIFRQKTGLTPSQFRKGLG